jgi:ADP-ribose pyrophosphatase
VTFRVRDTERVADAGFLAVDRVVIEGLDGVGHERIVVRHPGAVVVVPIAAGGRSALLVRQFRAAVGDAVLEVPAGKRDVDGEPPATTAARELEEEIGARAGRLVKLAEFYNTPGFCDEYTHLYVALDLEPLATRAAVTAEEHTMTVETVALDDVERLIATRELHDAKSIIGLLLAREYLAGSYPGIAGEALDPRP